MASGAPKAPACLPGLMLLLLVASAVVSAVALPWIEQDQRYEEEIERRADRLKRYLDLIDRLPGLEKRLGEIRADTGTDAYYLKGPDPSLAGVELQRRIETIVKTTGGELVSVQILPVQPQDVVSRVGVRVRFRGLSDALLNLLYDAESSKPLLFLDQLSVRAQRVGGRGPYNPQTDKLIVNFDAYGYFRRSGG